MSQQNYWTERNFITDLTNLGRTNSHTDDFPEVIVRSNVSGFNQMVITVTFYEENVKIRIS